MPRVKAHDIRKGFETGQRSGCGHSGPFRRPDQVLTLNPDRRDDSNDEFPVSMKHLLIIYHLPQGKMKSMADAVERGARHEDIAGVEVRVGQALASGADDLLWADALLLGTTENFGYMSGGMKDFLDRTFYPCEGKLEGMPFAMFISAGNDGTGALNAIRRIANGFSIKEVREPVLVVGALSNNDLERCEELGMAMAAGVELGVF